MPDFTQDEAGRLAALKHLEVLDSQPEAEFDGLVKAAAAVCGSPISLITLVDADRQWFKANVGLDGVTETPREVAFCAHAINSDGIFEVNDASIDPRFADNPLVTANPNIRFYAGAPLRLSCGSRVGTLCVIDQQPRVLDAQQKEILLHLSTAVVQALESRQLTRKLATSEAKFRALSTSSPLGIFSTDTLGACTYSNERWQSIFDMSESEALGQGWSSTLHPDDKQSVIENWTQSAQSLSEFDREFRVQHANGSVLSVRAISRPITNRDGVVSGHIGSVEDISERKAQEQALRKSEWLLAETGALADVGGWELDLATRNVRWTDQTCRIHALPAGHQPSLEEAIAFYAVDAQPVIRNAIEQAIKSGKNWDLEQPLNRADGKTIWVRSVGHAEYENSQPVRLVGAFQNVTDLVLQRQALEQAHERVNIATQSGNIGVWDLDLQTGKLTWSPQMYALYGLPVDTACIDQRSWVDCIHPGDRDSTVALAHEAIKTANGSFDIEFRTIWPDGSLHYVHASANIERDNQGNAVRMLGVNRDVTPLRNLTNQLAEQHELLQVTLQSIGDAVITADTESCVTWLNPAAERMTGWLACEATGKRVSEIFNIVHEDTSERADNPIKACLEQGKEVGLVASTVLISRTGARFGIENCAAPIRSRTGEMLGAVLVFHDVTEQRRLTNAMSYRAAHDSLTGLINRSEFERRLNDKLIVEDDEHALLFIDLDQFKLVNDACGHSEGDQLLIQIAKLLKHAVREGDTLARLGGDEFGVILQHCSSDEAQLVAQQICESMDGFRFEHQQRRFRIGTSIGLVPLDGRWRDKESALQAADSSCLAAKEAGRNRVHVWLDNDTSMHARREDMQWATRLEQALDHEGFVLYAQRIQSLAEDSTGTCAEVLVRMPSSDGTLIQPNAFLPAAERFHLATRIDSWVLKHSLQSLVAMRVMANVDTLFINLSGQSVSDSVFHKDAVGMLAQAGRKICQRVCLEITETAAVTNIADAKSFIEQVRSLGVRVALDDFGAGASSFGYLKTLPVDIVKIDGQFITGVIDDPLDGATVRCFVDIARLLNLQTVAECVENQDVLDTLHELDINYAQGYFLHNPEPLEHVLAQSSRSDTVPVKSRPDLNTQLATTV